MSAIAPIDMMPDSYAIPRQANNDSHLIAMWLHGRPATTRTTYELYCARFMAHVKKPLREVTLSDLQSFADTLAGVSANTQATILRVVKSLYSFAHKLGYVHFNVAAVVRTPPTPDTLAERYLLEEEVRAILEAEPDARNHAMLTLLYVGGLRREEVAGLRWKHFQPMAEGGLVAVLGKRSKVRSVLLPAAAWQEISSLRTGAGAEDPVFRSKKGGPLRGHMVWRVVRRAAERAGIDKRVSTHWLRHGHISHALDHGAPLHVVMHSVGHTNLQTTGRYAHARPQDGSSRYLPETGEWVHQEPECTVEGPALLAERRARGLTLGQAATQMQVTKTYLSDVEWGRIKPTRQAAERMRRWLEDDPIAAPAPPDLDGDAVRQARIALRLSQMKLAAQLDISDDTISGIETGKHKPIGRVAEVVRAWLDSQQG